MRWKKLRRDLSEPRRNASDYEAAKTSKVRLLVNEWWMYSQPARYVINRPGQRFELGPVSEDRKEKDFELGLEVQKRIGREKLGAFWVLVGGEIK